MEPEKEFMRQAIKLSVEKMQAGFGGPFGAVIVRNGEIVASGFNNVLTSKDPTAHAEVDAIRKATGALGTADLSDCDLYTSCEPCPMCFGAIYWAKIRKVYFGNSRQDAAAIGFDDAFIYQEMKKAEAERSISMQQLLPQEAKEAFSAWNNKADKTKY